MGPLSVDDPLCTGYEHHIQRWTWDEQDRLVSVDRSIELDFPAGYAGDPKGNLGAADITCMLDVGPVTTEVVNWHYDQGGRVRSWDSFYRDCEGTQHVENQLSYTGATVETHTDIIDAMATTSDSSRSQCDECGRVVTEEIVEPSPSRTKHYYYDDRGRVIKYEGEKSSSSWTYEAGIVAHPDLR